MHRGTYASLLREAPVLAVEPKNPVWDLADVEVRTRQKSAHGVNDTGAVPLLQGPQRKLRAFVFLGTGNEETRNVAPHCFDTPPFSPMLWPAAKESRYESDSRQTFFAH